jgi:hypothetical protein
MSIRIAKDNADPAKLVFTYNWRIVVDGKELHADTLTGTSPADSKQKVQDRKTVWKDAFHRYEIGYYVLGPATQFHIRGVYVAAPGE